MNQITIKTLILFLFAIVSTHTYSQTMPFHRIFEINEQGDTLLHHLASTTASTDAIVSISGRQIDGKYRSLVFAKYNQKGKSKAVKEFEFGQDSVTAIYDVDLTHNTDSLYFTFTMEVNDSIRTVVGKSTLERFNDFKANYINGVDYTSNNGVANTLITNYIDTTCIHVATDSGLITSRLNTKRTPMWSYRYSISDTLANTFSSTHSDVEVPEDSLIYVGGILDNDRLYQLIIDSVGDVKSGNMYELAVAGGIPTAQGIAALPGGRVAHAGYHQAGTDNAFAYVILVDSDGVPVWRKQISIGFKSTEIHGIDYAPNTDELVVVGTTTIVGDSTDLWTAGLSASDGNVEWMSGYGDRSTNPNLDFISLDVTNIGHSVVSNGYAESGRPAVSIMQLSAFGSTGCSDTITDFIVTDLAMATDTIITSRIAALTLTTDTLGYEEEAYRGLTEPTSRLEANRVQFCPNEEIMEPLISSISNVNPDRVSFMWSTNDFADSTAVDTIIAMEEGDYIVTLTITENECYSLCDTIQLTRTMEPTANISLDFSAYCLEDIVRLTANTSNGQSPFTYVWSTGETSQTISVSQEGSYDVKVYDACGDSTDASTVVEFPGPISAGISIDESSFCEEGTVELTANSNGVSPFSYQWSNGETSQTISVDQEGSYDVIVTDLCGDVAETSISVELPNSELDVSIDQECLGDGVILLIAKENEQGDDFTYKWSTDETTKEIEVTNGSYIVTISTGSCEGVAETTIVTIEDLDFTIIDNCDDNDRSNDNLYDLIVSNVSDTNDFYLLDEDNQRKQPTMDGSSFVFENLDRNATYEYFIDENCHGEGFAVPPCACFDAGNIFFPNASLGTEPTMADSLDITFAPVFICDDENVVISNYEFKVFNRWGQEVFSTTDRNQKWDGRYNGELVPSEMYVWYARFDQEGNPDNPVVIKGNVTTAYY